MARPISTRQIRSEPPRGCFKPVGVPLRELQEVVLTLDEFEALRLADHEGHYQDEVAERMGVSRATVGRILAAARGKVAGAFVEGKAIRFEGGVVEFRRGPHGRGRGGGNRRLRSSVDTTDQTGNTPKMSDEMPDRDGTGPSGEGPGTGRGMGRRARQGQGGGQGRGRGQGGGRGRGRDSETNEEPRPGTGRKRRDDSPETQPESND